MGITGSRLRAPGGLGPCGGGVAGRGTRWRCGAGPGAAGPHLPAAAPLGLSVGILLKYSKNGGKKQPERGGGTRGVAVQPEARPLSLQGVGWEEQRSRSAGSPLAAGSRLNCRSRR